MLSRRGFIQGVLLGIGTTLLPAQCSWRLRPSERPAVSDEVVIVDGWVLLADDLAAVLG